MPRATTPPAAGASELREMQVTVTADGGRLRIAPQLVRSSAGMLEDLDLFVDEDGYPRLLTLTDGWGRGWAEPFDAPLRVTRREWDAWLEHRTGLDWVALVHPRFSLSYGAEWDQEWDVCEVALVRTHRGHRRRFGPHRRQGLAEEKLLRFLVAEQCVELLPERRPGGAGGGRRMSEDGRDRKRQRPQDPPPPADAGEPEAPCPPGIEPERWIPPPPGVDPKAWRVDVQWGSLSYRIRREGEDAVRAELGLPPRSALSPEEAAAEDEQARLTMEVLDSAHSFAVTGTLGEAVTYRRGDGAEGIGIRDRDGVVRPLHGVAEPGPRRGYRARGGRLPEVTPAFTDGTALVPSPLPLQGALAAFHHAHEGGWPRNGEGQPFFTYAQPQGTVQVTMAPAVGEPERRPVSPPGSRCGPSSRDSATSTATS